MQNLTNFCSHALISTPNVPKKNFALQNSHTLPLDRKIVLYFFTRNNDLECKSARFTAVDRRSVADKQLHWNGIIYSASVAHAAFQSPRANGAHDFPSCANRSIHVPTGNFPFAPLEKWRRFFCLGLHRWEKDGVAYQKTWYYRSSTSTLYSAPSYPVLEDYPCTTVGAGVC